MIAKKKEDEMMVAPGVDLHSQFSPCYCLTIPAVASKTSKSDETYQSLQDPKIAGKYVLKPPKPPKML